MVLRQGTDRALCVLVTPDEMAKLLDLPEGYSIDRVEVLDKAYRPAVALIISGPSLPTCGITIAPMTVDLDNFRMRLGLARERPLPEADHQGERSPAAMYPSLVAAPRPMQPPPKPVIPDSNPVAWPEFPGQAAHTEALQRRPEPVTKAPTDDLDDIHFGGPR